MLKNMTSLLVIVFLFVNVTNGQDSLAAPKKIYKLKYKSELLITAGLFAFNILGFYQLGEKPTLSASKINSLNKDDIWAFDRSAVKQSYPAPSNIYDLSDVGLWTSYVSPALLFFDDKIREDWLDITMLYFETQAINLNLYLWGGAVLTERIRPIVYYEEVSMDYKLGKETTDSFFSGHVSMTAGASFFIARVLSDYHPELGAKKWLLYTAAIIPPAFVGYCRYRGYMHFPSDIFLGFAVGAAVGILVPHLHKNTREENKDLSIVPFIGRYSGLAFSLRL